MIHQESQAAGPDALGGRADAQKPRMDLLAFDAIEAVARVGTKGAAKYSDRNWEKGMRWGRLLGSLLRHAFAHARGEDRDPETGELHMAHVAWNALALTSYMQRPELAGFDDRPASIKARELAVGQKMVGLGLAMSLGGMPGLAPLTPHGIACQAGNAHFAGASPHGHPHDHPSSVPYNKSGAADAGGGCPWGRGR